MSDSLGNVLLTGFDPFGGESINPSWEIAHALDGEVIAGHRVVAGLLPTAFDRAPQVMQALIERHRPRLIMGLGQAGGRDGISIERVAINIIDARIADNLGRQPIDVAIVENAPNAYFSTLPIKPMLAALRAQGVAATISQSAGTFVCNQVFFVTMHYLAGAADCVRAGFLHVPYLPDQVTDDATKPSMPLEASTNAIRCCLRVALTVQGDTWIAAGSLY